jgi:hypothetical protein
MIGRMKVFSDAAANVSPLETWLREETSPSTPSPAADSAAPAAVSAQAPASLYDSAEGLLNLDVWNGAPPEARSLATSSVARSDARDWAEHVIEPLLR